MGFHAGAHIVWGVEVQRPYDEDTGAPIEAPGFEDGDFADFPEDSRLEWVTFGHYDDYECPAILTFKGSYQPYVYEPGDVEEIDSSEIHQDLYNHRKSARKAEEERACDYPNLPDLRDGKWVLVTSYG